VPQRAGCSNFLHDLRRTAVRKHGQGGDSRRGGNGDLRPQVSIGVRSLRYC